MSFCTDGENSSCLPLEIATGLDSASSGQADRVVIPSPMISDALRLKMEIVFQITLFTATSLVGIVANVINITVYWRQGIKDSMAVGLFALSVSDFFVVFLPLVTSGCYMADHLYPQSPVRFKAVGGVSTTRARHLFYSLSCTITAFLSVERCMCIVRPFKVKLIFTRRRTIISMIVIVVFYLVTFGPLFAAHQLRWQRSPRRNFSYVLTVWYHPIASYVDVYNTSLISILIPTAAQVIVTCTAVIMTNGLRKAAKFRQMATGAASNARKESPEGDKQPAASDKDAKTTDKEAVVLDSRDARLVKTMVILVSLLSVANVPYLALEYTQLAVPEMNPSRPYQNTFRLFSSINFLLGSVNASVNVFVYYYTGSRFRQSVKEMFGCKK